MIDTKTHSLQVKSIGVRRSERWLFRGLSFHLMAGETLQVIGENGSGKTSLLRSLCGLLAHAEGEILWPQTNDVQVIPVFIGHKSAVKPELTVFENLAYHPIAGNFLDTNEILKAIELVQLSQYSDVSARALSAGQIRRIGLARLILASSNFWILDEPFTALDKEGCKWLEQQITKFTIKGGSVILTSHQEVNFSVLPKVINLDQAAIDVN